MRLKQLWYHIANLGLKEHLTTLWPGQNSKRQRRSQHRGTICLFLSLPFFWTEDVMLPKTCLYLKHQLQVAVPSCLTLESGYTYPLKVLTQGFYCRFTLQSLPVSGRRPHGHEISPLVSGLLCKETLAGPLLSSHSRLHILTDPLTLPVSGSNPGLHLLITIELPEFSCNFIFISSKGCEGKDLVFFVHLPILSI